MIGLAEVGGNRKVISPVDDISTVLSKTLIKRSANLRSMYTVDRHLVHDRQWTTLSVMQEKCFRDVSMPFGCCNCGWWIDMGHVQQTVPLQGKVPGDWSRRFRASLLLTSRSFRFLASLKAFRGGLLKILLVVLSSRRIWKFLEMIFLATRFLGWKVVTNGTPSLAVLFAAPLFKIWALIWPMLVLFPF